jgi:hypothetical protein
MRTLLLSLIITFSFAVQAQNEAILAQIDSAKTYNQMPILHITTVRDAGKLKYRLVNGKVEQLNQKSLEGETFTLYFPAYTRCVSDPEMIYKMASTTPIITDSTVLIYYLALMDYSSFADGTVLRRWREKYVNLFQKQPKAKEAPKEIIGSSNAWVIYDKDQKPVKVYANVGDCMQFINNKPFSNQQVNLIYCYIADTARWEPSMREVQEDYIHPEMLSDKFLAQKTVYVVMQSHFKLALKIYDNKAYCQKYIDGRGDGVPTVLEVPYFYRDKRSYDEIWRIREKRLGIKPK